MDRKLGRTFQLLAFACGLGLLFAAQARADTVLDPQIYVCTGCTTPPGGDPNLIDPNSINVGFSGSHTAIAPLLILVGVPNEGSAPTLSLPMGVNPAASGTYYGLTNATSGTTAGVLEGMLTSSTTGDAYSAAGISGGDNSNNWTNWEGFDISKLGITVGSGFDLYAYAINYALNSDSKSGAVNSPITIDFSGIANGSYVIAFNCATAGSTCSGGDVGSTPFTNAGDATTVVPEPNSLALLGLALGALAFGARKRLFDAV